MHLKSPRSIGGGLVVGSRRKSPRTDSFDVVRTIGLDLPDVEESTMYGAPALKIRGKLLACMASHKSAEPGSLVVRIGFEEREALIAEEPRIYYVKPHYQDHAAVLVRLALIDREALRDLLTSAWRTVTASAPKRRTRPSRRRTRSGAQ
jgi:hypothetical protein